MTSALGRHKVDRVIKDGEVLALAQSPSPSFTPGHTSGGPAGVGRAAEGKKCQSIVFADSISGVSGRLPVQRSSRLDRGVPLNL